MRPNRGSFTLNPSGPGFDPAAELPMLSTSVTASRRLQVASRSMQFLGGNRGATLP